MLGPNVHCIARQSRSHSHPLPSTFDHVLRLPMDDPGRGLPGFGHPVRTILCRLFGTLAHLPSYPGIDNPDREVVRRDEDAPLPRSALQHLRTREPTLPSLAIRSESRYGDCHRCGAEQRDRPGHRPAHHRDRFWPGDHHLAALETWCRDGRARILIHYHQDRIDRLVADLESGSELFLALGRMQRERDTDQPHSYRSASDTPYLGGSPIRSCVFKASPCSPSLSCSSQRSWKA